MEIDSYLKSDESIIKILHPTKSIPLRLEDWIRMPFFIIFCIALFIILKPDATASLQSKQLNTYFIIPLLIIFGLFMSIGKLIHRRFQTINSIYYITNQRIVFFNKPSKSIAKSFYFNQFIEIDYRENAYGFGYIILGKQEPFANRGGRIFGINPLEHKNVMNNIVDVKQEYDLIKNLAKNSSSLNLKI